MWEVGALRGGSINPFSLNMVLIRSGPLQLGPLHQVEELPRGNLCKGSISYPSRTSCTGTSFSASQLLNEQGPCSHLVLITLQACSFKKIKGNKEQLKNNIIGLHQEIQSKASCSLKPVPSSILKYSVIAVEKRWAASLASRLH